MLEIVKSFKSVLQKSQWSKLDWKRSMEYNMKVKKKALIILEVYGLGELKFKSIEDLTDRIYKLAHIANGSCKNPHDDWKREIEEEYESLKKGKLI